MHLLAWLEGRGMSPLLKQQFTFTLNIAKLIIWIYEQGYTATLAEGYDDDGVGYMKKSLHYDRLAQDINLFRDGTLLINSESYFRVGQAWKALNPLNRWGGDFPGDGNHFSMEFQGRK
jgi:hypothetical protein